MPNRKPCGFPGCLNMASGPYCGNHYRHLKVYGEMRPILGHPGYPVPATICRIEGCEKKRKGDGQSMCSMHTARKWRHGDESVVHVPVARERFITSHGYVEIRAVGHPLAGRHGKIYEHRKVLFDEVGPDPQPCAWCRRTLMWDGHGDERLEVDHFNADREDNHPANLLPCCRKCNTERGSIGRWFREKASA